MRTHWGVELPYGGDGAYALWGVSSIQRPLFNSGVIAFNPSKHQQVFLDVYHLWLDGGLGSLHEMIPLNLVLQQLGLCAELPYLYNQLVGVMYAVFKQNPRRMEQWLGWPKGDSSPFTLINQLKKVPSFLHFAGCHSLMRHYLSSQDQIGPSDLALVDQTTQL